MTTQTVGSLFTGIGGMDLGFECAGFEIAWQVESSDFCNRVLAKHWPNVRRFKDVRDFHPTVDVECLIGGFPCKQTSNAAAIQGKRNGLSGKDSGLWFEQLRIIKAVRPRWVVIENPPGAKTWSAQIEGGMADSGYGVQRFELEAWDFGAAHRRRRVFWIANRDGTRLSLTRPQRPSTTQAQSRGAVDRNAWLPVVPGALRVADGVPGGLDRRERIEAIGNSVFPTMAEWIARKIWTKL